LPTSTCHVRKVSVGLKRTYRISAGDGTGRGGELLGMPRTAQSRRRIRLFRDEQCTQLVATVHDDAIDTTLLFALADEVGARRHT